MSADPIISADGVKAVSAVALDAKKRAKEESILGRTVNKFGRIVLISRKKYSHMRKCWDLLLDVDGNQTRFTKLSESSSLTIAGWFLSSSLLKIIMFWSTHFN